MYSHDSGVLHQLNELCLFLTVSEMLPHFLGKSRIFHLPLLFNWDGVGKRNYIMPKRNEPGVSVQHSGRLTVGRIIIMYTAVDVPN